MTSKSRLQYLGYNTGFNGEAHSKLEEWTEPLNSIDFDKSL